MSIQQARNADAVPDLDLTRPVETRCLAIARRRWRIHLGRWASWLSILGGWRRWFGLWWKSRALISLSRRGGGHILVSIGGAYTVSCLLSVCLGESILVDGPCLQLLPQALRRQTSSGNYSTTGRGWDRGLPPLWQSKNSLWDSCYILNSDWWMKSEKWLCERKEPFLSAWGSNSQRLGTFWLPLNSGRICNFLYRWLGSFRISPWNCLVIAYGAQGLVMWNIFIHQYTCSMTSAEIIDMTVRLKDQKRFFNRNQKSILLE